MTLDLEAIRARNEETKRHGDQCDCGKWDGEWCPFCAPDTAAMCTDIDALLAEVERLSVALEWTKTCAFAARQPDASEEGK